MILASSKFFHTSLGPLVVTYTVGGTPTTWNFTTDGTTLYLPTVGAYTFTFNRTGNVLIKGVSAGGSGSSGEQNSIYAQGGAGGGGGAAHYTGISVTIDPTLTYAGRVGSGAWTGAGGSGANTEFQIQSSTFYLKLTSGKHGDLGTGYGTGGQVIVGSGGVAGGDGGYGGWFSGSNESATVGSAGACGGGGGGGSDQVTGGKSGGASTISGTNTSGSDGTNGSGTSPGSKGTGGSGVLFNGVYYGGGGGGGGAARNDGTPGAGGAGKQGILAITYVP